MLALMSRARLRPAGLGGDERNAILSCVWGRKRQRIRALRRQYDWIASDRVAEAVIDLAGDDEHELLVLVEAARIDWRDVLMWDEEARRPSFVDEAAHQFARNGAVTCGTDRARRCAARVNICS